MLFESYTKRLNNYFSNIDKYEDKSYYDCKKVEKLLKGIKYSENELKVPK